MTNEEELEELRNEIHFMVYDNHRYIKRISESVDLIKKFLQTGMDDTETQLIMILNILEGKYDYEEDLFNTDELGNESEMD